MHLSADSALPEACVDVTMYVCIINLQGHYIVLSEQYLSGFVWIKIRGLSTSKGGVATTLYKVCSNVRMYDMLFPNHLQSILPEF